MGTAVAPQPQQYEIVDPEQHAQETGEKFEVVDDPNAQQGGLWNKVKSFGRGVMDYASQPMQDTTPDASLKDQVMQTIKPNSPMAQKVSRSAEMSVPGQVGESAVKALPTVQGAGRLFEQVEQAGKAAGQTVNPDSALMDIANRARELKAAGHELPGVMRAFIQRMTPTKLNRGPVTPLTFQEARDMFSKATNLTASERMQLGGKMPAVLKQFTSALDSKIREAAGAMGQGEDYAKAMKDYPLAKKVADFKDSIPSLATKAAKWGAAAAGAGAAGRLGYNMWKGME